GGAAAHAIGRDHGEQAPGRVWLRGEGHGKRAHRRRGDGADGSVVEGDRVVIGRRTEAVTDDRDRARVGGQQVGRVREDDRPDRWWCRTRSSRPSYRASWKTLQ